MAKGRGGEIVPRIPEEAVCIQIHGATRNISMGAENADIAIATPLVIICEESLLLQEILDDWRKVNFTFILKKREEEDLRNDTIVGLTLVLGKTVEHVLLESISNM